MKDVTKRIIVGVAAILFYPLALAYDLAVWACKVFELEIFGNLSDRRLLFLLFFSAALKFIAYGSVLALIYMGKKDIGNNEQQTSNVELMK